MRTHVVVLRSLEVACAQIKRPLETGPRRRAGSPGAAGQVRSIARALFQRWTGPEAFAFALSTLASTPVGAWRCPTPPGVGWPQAYDWAHVESWARPISPLRQWE